MNLTSLLSHYLIILPKTFILQRCFFMQKKTFFEPRTLLHKHQFWPALPGWCNYMENNHNETGLIICKSESSVVKNIVPRRDGIILQVIGIVFVSEKDGILLKYPVLCEINFLIKSVFKCEHDVKKSTMTGKKQFTKGIPRNHDQFYSIDYTIVNCMFKVSNT